jgi:hypothetical protein
MPDIGSLPASVPAPAGPGLMARLLGVLVSPRETYAAVAARPRSLGVLAVVLVLIVGAQIGLLSTEAGKDLMLGQILDQQVRALESSGRPVDDQMYAQMEAQMTRFLYVIPVSNLVVIPIVLAISAGLLTVVFSMLLGGAATFRHVYAVVAHSSVIVAVQALFTSALSLAAGKPAGANLAIFVPMLEEGAFATLLLSTIDLFLVWSTISMAIGIGVLYKRRTGPVATGLLLVYAAVAVVIAFVRS